jgi:hypothetical protein
MNILPEKCGTKELPSRPSSANGSGNESITVTVTVKDVLNETLHCADQVHKFIEKMQILKQKCHKDLLNEGKWTAMDWHFKGMLESIFVKKTKVGDMKIDAGDRHVEYIKQG